IHPRLHIPSRAPAWIVAGPAGPSPNRADDVRYPADVVRDEDGGRVRIFRGGDILPDALYHGGAVVESPVINVVFVGDRFSVDDTRSIMRSVRGISSDSRFQDLARYGVKTFGMRVSSQQIPDAGHDVSDMGIQ